MLTYEQIKAIEAALGADAARPVVEAIQSTDTRVLASLMAELATKADHERLRGDTRTAIESLRAEMRQLHGETKAEIKQLRGEMLQLHGETKAEIEQLRGETKAEIEQLRGETRAEFAVMRGEFKKLDLQIKLLIALAVLAIAMFSPNLAALVRLVK